MAADSLNYAVGGATVTIGSDLGYIKDGVTVTPSVELYTIEGVEQLLTPAEAYRVSEGWEISFTLCEPTMANLQIAVDCDNTPAAGVVDIGDNQFTPTKRVIVMTGIVPGGDAYVRTWQFDACVVSGPAEIKFTKGQETNLAVTFMALYDDQTNNRVSELTDATA